MVDALIRARRWLRLPFGCIIDLRPADLVPRVEIEMPDRSIVGIGGLVVDDERRVRHAAADAAVHTAAEELRDYIAAKWRQTHLAPETYAKSAALLASHAGARLWLREKVAVRTLTPR